jgi:hypothetical protein
VPTAAAGPGLAAPAFPAATAAIMPVVGDNDLRRNRLEIAPQAGHLPEEPGALEGMIGLGPRWLVAGRGKEAGA